MSQVITLKRQVPSDELALALQQSGRFKLGAEHSWGLSVVYLKDPSALITFANGQIEATSPTDDLLEDLQSLARLLVCNVVVEDEELYAADAGAYAGDGVIKLYWPILVIVLTILLIWRW